MTLQNLKVQYSIDSKVCALLCQIYEAIGHFGTDLLTERSGDVKNSYVAIWSVWSLVIWQHCYFIFFLSKQAVACTRRTVSENELWKLCTPVISRARLRAYIATDGGHFKSCQKRSV